MTEQEIEEALIEKLVDLKYEYRPDIRDRAALEQNFREKFEALNRVRLTDAEFARLLGEIITPDVFTAAKTLRSINAFTRDDGTPLNSTLVNIKDWCKNDFEVIHQLRINTDYGHHRYDVILLINGVPCVQIELKTLGVNPRRAMGGCPELCVNAFLKFDHSVLELDAESGQRGLPVPDRQSPFSADVLHGQIEQLEQGVVVGEGPSVFRDFPQAHVE